MDTDVIHKRISFITRCKHTAPKYNYFFADYTALELVFYEIAFAAKE